MRSPARNGMTLLEVLLALAILLLSMAALSQLVGTASDQALQVQMQSRGTRLAQSKMAEYVAGVVRLESGGSGNFEEDAEPDWNWEATTQSEGSAAGLYLVTITVSRDSRSLGRVETSLTQYVLDPRMKGNIPAKATTTPTTTTDTASTTSSASSTGSTSSTTTPTTGSTPTSGSSTGGSSTRGGSTGGSSSGGGASGAGGGMSGGSGGASTGGGSKGGR